MASKPVNTFPRRFVFHGNAVAAEFFLTKIDGVELEEPAIHPVTGQSSLPVIGGRSESEVLKPFIPPKMESVFSYTGARTKALGIFERENAVTTVEAAVSDVRVTNRPAPGESQNRSPIDFRARELSLSLRSTHPPTGEQPRIVFVKTQFEGMSLNDRPIELELNRELMGLTRWVDLEHEFCNSREFFDSCSFCPTDSGGQAVFGEGIPRACGSYALTSFVQSIQWGDDTIHGHVLSVTGFGTIYFGEILLNDRERRVTMVRMQLGSASAGQAVLVETDPNGNYIPPR